MSAVLAGLAAVLLVMAGALPAEAHTQFLSSAPSDGSASATAPATLVLTFSQAPLAGTADVIAESNTGEKVNLPVPVLGGPAISVDWPANQPAGTYRASWRVVSTDGHPVTGTLTFSYGVARPLPFVSQTTTASPGGGGSSSLLPIIAIVVAGALIGGTIAFFVVRARRKA